MVVGEVERVPHLVHVVHHLHIFVYILGCQSRGDTELNQEARTGSAGSIYICIYYLRSNRKERERERRAGPASHKHEVNIASKFVRKFDVCVYILG